jgi:hypothetical protein
MAASSHLFKLTANLGRLSLRNNAPIQRLVAGTMHSSASLPARRFFSSKKPDHETSLQHKEWVKFQQSIAVDGFETGQTLEEVTKKSRGGKSKVKSTSAQEKIKDRQRLTDVGGGQFPPMRYSDEETERLLAEAYAALPERAGKRGTRNLKRQGTRWHLVRKIRKKYKWQMAQYQTRKMEKRSKKVREVKEMLGEAPDVRQGDRAYQAQVFAKWATIMSPVQEEVPVPVQAQIDEDA